MWLRRRLPVWLRTVLCAALILAGIHASDIHAAQTHQYQTHQYQGVQAAIADHHPAPCKPSSDPKAHAGCLSGFAGVFAVMSSGNAVAIVKSGRMACRDVISLFAGRDVTPHCRPPNLFVQT